MVHVVPRFGNSVKITNANYNASWTKQQVNLKDRQTKSEKVNTLKVQKWVLPGGYRFSQTSQNLKT